MHGPDRVVGLDSEEYGVKGLRYGADVTQVYRFYRDGELLFLRGDAEAFLLHRVHVRAPRVYERNVVSGSGEVATRDTADGARPKDGQPFKHLEPHSPS